MWLDGQDCGSQNSLETLCNRRNSNRCDSETWASGFVTEVFVGCSQLCQVSQREDGCIKSRVIE
jgi:hypothetical protein